MARKLYVKLWCIEGGKQRHIAGKSFDVQRRGDLVNVYLWIEDVVTSQYLRDVYG
jgi:hypothetical protein